MSSRTIASSSQALKVPIPMKKDEIPSFPALIKPNSINFKVNLRNPIENQEIDEIRRDFQEFKREKLLSREIEEENDGSDLFRCDETLAGREKESSAKRDQRTFDLDKVLPKKRPRECSLYCYGCGVTRESKNIPGGLCEACNFKYWCSYLCEIPSRQFFFDFNLKRFKFVQDTDIPAKTSKRTSNKRELVDYCSFAFCPGVDFIGIYEPFDNHNQACHTCNMILTKADVNLQLNDTVKYLARFNRALTNLLKDN